MNTIYKNHPNLLAIREEVAQFARYGLATEKKINEYCGLLDYVVTEDLNTKDDPDLIKAVYWVTFEDDKKYWKKLYNKVLAYRKFTWLYNLGIDELCSVDKIQSFEITVDSINAIADRYWLCEFITDEKLSGTLECTIREILSNIQE